VDSNGIIHGCVSNAAINGTHALVVQDTGSPCPKGTTELDWRQQGPAGPQGPQGPPGTFTGSLTSPDGLYSLNVTDAGITLTGPGATVTISTAGVAVQGTQITLNGCTAPVAREGDLVNATRIAGGSPTVCAG
jgi:hypothetical protein